jgi:hypothetical protein
MVMHAVLLNCTSMLSRNLSHAVKARWQTRKCEPHARPTYVLGTSETAGSPECLHKTRIGVLFVLNPKGTAGIRDAKKYRRVLMQRLERLRVAARLKTAYHIFRLDGFDWSRRRSRHAFQ